MAHLRVIGGEDSIPDVDHDDEEFLAHLLTDLTSLDEVEAIHLGGSRGSARNAPDADWDVSLHYRGDFDHEAVRKLADRRGWRGDVFPAGEWGPVMNGGAWLTIGDRKVDLHWRDLDDLDVRLDEAERGEFEVYRLPFYLAGVPTYLPLAELSQGRVLWGELPRPAMTMKMRDAFAWWWGYTAQLEVAYAEKSAERGDIVGTLGLLARIIIEAGHCTLCADGRWATNEKRIVQDAGLGELANLLGAGGTTPDELDSIVQRVGTVCDGLPVPPPHLRDPDNPPPRDPR